MCRLGRARTGKLGSVVARCRDYAVSGVGLCAGLFMYVALRVVTWVSLSGWSLDLWRIVVQVW